MSAKREIFISVDVETSGPIPGEYSLLTIGACEVEDDNKVFTCKIKPISHNADPKALKVTGLSLDDLDREGLTPSDAMIQFRDWIKTISDTKSNIIFVGLNAAFDWSFINYYFHKYIGENPFGFSALDIKSLYMGKFGCNWNETKSSSISALLNPKRHGNHDALYDAQYQAELFRLIRSNN